jgi:hypothetical protein
MRSATNRATVGLRNLSSIRIAAHTPRSYCPEDSESRADIVRGSKSRPELLTCGDPNRNGDFATFGFLNHMISRSRDLLVVRCTGSRRRLG